MNETAAWLEAAAIATARRRPWRPVFLLTVVTCMAGLGGCVESYGGKGDVAPVAAASVDHDKANVPAAKSRQAVKATPVKLADNPPAAPAVAPSAEEKPADGAAYLIGPQDVLDITVFQVPDLTRSVQVADSGSINLPLVGNVPASGRTSQALERDLTARLGARYLQQPQVSVYVKEFNSQRVTVEGAVKKPGVYPVRGRGSLSQLLATAEGLDSDKSSGQITIFHKGGGSPDAYDLDDIQAGKVEDPGVHQGDRIVVATSSAKVGFGYVVKAIPAATLFRPF